MVGGCAVVRSPQGGDKDILPPKILASEPLNESVNFTGNQINLEFDEYVTLKGANQELIVSPPLKYPVEFKQRNKTLTVTWKDTLEENTTYLFQFGKGIADLNEGNILDSNVFVFSTSSFIDSFEVRGNIVNAFERKAEVGVWVMLYTENTDSLPYKELPRYFAKSDEQGKFHVKYLKPGDYKIFALKPLNAGYLYDTKGECIAFLENTVTATKAPSKPKAADTLSTDTLPPAQNTAPTRIDTLTNDTLMRDTLVTDSAQSTPKPELLLFIETDSTQYVKSFAQLKTQGLVLEFNRPVDTLEINELSGAENATTWVANWSADRDSVRYWFSAKNEYDSLLLEVRTSGFQDTIFFRKYVDKGARMKKNEAEKPGLVINSSAAREQLHFRPWTLLSETPIAAVALDSAIFTAADDTVDIRPYVRQTFYGLTVDFPWQQDTRYTLVLPDSAITDRFGNTHDSLIFSFTTTREEDFGQLYVTYQFPDLGHPFVWELLTADGKPVDKQTVNATGELEYEHLKTGKYQVRLTYDQNANGQWDTGHYLSKRQPEPVKYYGQPLEIRSNWASEIEWKVED